MTRLEVLGLIIVALVIFGTPAAAFGYEGYLRSATPNEFTLIGQDGEWSPKTLRVRQGEPVRLRLTSGDVMHGFAIKGMNVRVREIHPGKFATFEFIADKPGTYTFGCTILCSPKHEDMRGTLIVEPVGESAADAPAEHTLARQTGGAEQAPAKAADAQRIAMEAVDFAFSPTELRAKPGIVEIEITNNGRMAHGLWIPKLGVNEDLRKGKTKTIRFTAAEPGKYDIRCNDELCGTQEEHDSLTATLIVE
jgi:heme/copper-type cytochrome/quinol oxidase subunit 2